jgi:hypothetical protein
VDTTKFFPKSTTGHNAFRFMVSRENVQNDPEISTVFTDNARLVTWAGDDKRILVYPVDYGKSYNITCTHLEKLSDTETRIDEDADICGSSLPGDSAILTLRSVQPGRLRRYSLLHLQ